MPPNGFEFTGRRRRSGAMKGWAARPALTLGRGPRAYARFERRARPPCLAARSRTLPRHDLPRAAA